MIKIDMLYTFLLQLSTLFSEVLFLIKHLPSDVYADKHQVLMETPSEVFEDKIAIN